MQRFLMEDVMTNAYCDLATLKSAGALNISSSGYDGRLLALLEEASRLIDGYCNRHFYVLHATRRFDGDGGQQLALPDLVSLDRVRVRRATGGPAVTWPAAAYRLYPLDAAPDQPWGRPYTRLAAAPEQRFPVGPAAVEISGRWGFRQVTESGGLALDYDAPLTAAATSLTLASGGVLSPGRTVNIGSEQLYVTAVDGQQATVVRGVNGSRAASHEAGAAIAVYRYPGPVVEACLQLAAEMWQGRNGLEIPADRRQKRGPAFGLGKEVEGLLSAYCKLTI